jgi:predicted metalloprotease with PDZ domain
VPVYIFDDEYNVTSYPYLGGLIGNDLLRRFNLIINYERRDIYLMPNRHYRDPFDYAYTGFSFYDIEGVIRITDIMVGSPAEKAGFKTDDIIIAVNNNFSNNVQTYKNMLQSTGEAFRVLINRGGELKIVTLKVKSILR